MKKNFILLSKVAKEKKYAQEYLGLLARRGDLGSIRIGKRWYTTEEWFSEFLKDAQARKAEMKIAENSAEVASEPAKVLIKEKKEEIERVSFAERVKLDKEIRAAKSFARSHLKISRPEPRKEKKILTRSEERVEIKLPNVKREEEKKEITPQFQEVPVRSSSSVRKFETVDLRKFRVKRPISQKVPARVMSGLGIAERGKAQEVFQQQEKAFQEWKTVYKSSSPDFTPSDFENLFFPKFAFSAAAVLVLVLLFQVGWIYQDKVKSFVGVDSGIVAGAEDSKVGLKTVKSLSNEYLENRENNIKEDISLSRVLLSAALEKENLEEPNPNPQQ